MSKTRKFIIRSLLSILAISFSLYVAGYRMSSESLVKEYIEESGLNLSNKPRLVYDSKGIKSYLLESNEYYISLSLESAFFLWRFPVNEVNSYSERFDKVSGSLIIRPKFIDGESIDSLFIYYPEMFKYNQQTQNMEVELVYLSEQKNNLGYVFQDNKYEKKSFLHLEDSIYSLKSKLPTYIKNESLFYSIFTGLTHFFEDEDVELEICQKELCKEYTYAVNKAKIFLELYDSIDYEERKKTINKLHLTEADATVEFKNSDSVLSEKNNKLYYFMRDDFVYILIPEFLETTTYNDGIESTVWEHGLYVVPVEFYKTFPGLEF